MTTEQDFHPDLLALLEKVWCGRKDIKSYDGIYLLYSSNQGGAKPSLNEDELEQFLESLPIDFTFRNSFGKEKLGQILVQDHGEWPNLKVARKRFDKKTLWDTFYHFNGEEEGAYKRIYIHVADTYVTNVLIIVRELLPLMPQIRGFLKFKIAGPGGVDRKDQIIIYLRNEQAQSEVIEELRKLARLQELKEPPRLFEPGVPMVVKEVEGLPGVGIADEPPAVSLEKDPNAVESFGTYLSKVLYWAVEECWYGEWEEFLDDAKIALRVAGIDPREPHLHARRLEIEELDRLGRIAQSQRKSLRAEAAAAASTAATDPGPALAAATDVARVVTPAGMMTIARYPTEDR